MSGKRVLALYAAVLLGFAVVLCRLYFLAENHTYAARAEAQSTVRLSLPARRGSFYDHSGLLLTGLETRYLALCFPGENNYTRLYAFTDSAGQALLYRNRNRSAPFLLEVDRDLSGRGIRCFATARRCAEVPLCQHLIGYLDAEGRGIAGLEKALDSQLAGTKEHDTLVCAVTAQGNTAAHPAGQQCGGRAADDLPPGAACRRSGGRRHHDQRLHSGSGHGHCCGSRQRQRTGL